MLILYSKNIFITIILYISNDLKTKILRFSDLFNYPINPSLLLSISY